MTEVLFVHTQLFSSTSFRTEGVRPHEWEEVRQEQTQRRVERAVGAPCSWFLRHSQEKELGFSEGAVDSWTGEGNV